MQGKHLARAPLADEVRLLSHGIPPEGARPSLREIEMSNPEWSAPRAPVSQVAEDHRQAGEPWDEDA